MKKNIGVLDMTVRIVVAAIIAFLVGLDFVVGIPATILSIFAIVLAVTGFSNYCPFYNLVGLRTRE
ncbi:YgaP family membrane protein [Maribacter sp. CXY002]|uniref:YgaP family membrane protein n=1 Tax=Maribacter luteocoastalis TaxID=3407671 RepID=UPI003B6792F8